MKRPLVVTVRATKGVRAWTRELARELARTSILMIATTRYMIRTKTRTCSYRAR
jgi:hypothetical protein